MDYMLTFEDGSSGYLSHHGVKGMKWGVWNEETKARHLNSEGPRVFVSGSSKTQFRDSGYYRRNLPKGVRKELKSEMKNNSTILVGDAPGIDRQVQNYLKGKRYAKVEIYGPEAQPRYKAGKNWVYNAVVNPNAERGSKEWLAEKDRAMTDRSTKGIAVILDEGANATRNNVKRMNSQNKPVSVYQLDKEGKRKDRKVSSYSI